MQRLVLVIAAAFAMATSLLADKQKEPVQNEALRKELQAMYDEDQRMRTENIRALGKKGVDPTNPPSPFTEPKLFLSLMGGALQGMEIYRRNGERMEQIVEEHGWPVRRWSAKTGRKPLGSWSSIKMAIRSFKRSAWH